MKIVTMVMVVAILLNMLAPTLAHAAIDLAEINANTLVRDAYVAVTYYDSKGKQKLEKGWIDAIGETSFTIREGRFRDKKTIAYDKVVSVIMSEESTAPVKQMNEVNRFIRNMKAREIEQAKKESKAEDIQWLDPINTKASANNGDANTEGNDGYEVVDWYVGERASQVIVPKGRYVEVTYRGEYGKAETVGGFVREMDETELTVYQGGLRRRIPVDRIGILMVGDNASQLQRARRVMDREYELDTRDSRIIKKLFGGALGGGLLGVLGGLVGGRTGEGGWDTFGAIIYGVGIGYVIGVPTGVSWIDPYDSLLYTMSGSLIGGGVGYALADIYTFFTGPVIGSLIMSELFRKKIKVRRFSVGVAPNREGNLSAVVTLRF